MYYLNSLAYGPLPSYVLKFNYYILRTESIPLLKFASSCLQCD